MSNLKQTLYEGDWLRLVRIDHWESCERTHGQGMAVIIIAVTPADEVLFVEQFRVPLGARTIEMPAGLVGDDHAQDTLEDAARRELIEETGWSPGKVEVLLVGPTSSGMNSKFIEPESSSRNMMLGSTLELTSGGTLGRSNGLPAATVERRTRVAARARRWMRGMAVSRCGFRSLGTGFRGSRSHRACGRHGR